VIEYHRPAGFEVGRDGGERNGQRAEIPDRVRRPGEAGEELGHALSRDDTLRELDPAPLNRQREQVVVLREFAIDREIATVHRIGEQPVPILGPDDRIELRGRVPHRVQAADHAAHARAGNHVHRNSRLLEHLQHADVGEPPRRAAGEGDADLLAARPTQRQNARSEHQS